MLTLTPGVDLSYIETIENLGREVEELRALNTQIVRTHEDQTAELTRLCAYLQDKVASLEAQLEAETSSRGTMLGIILCLSQLGFSQPPPFFLLFFPNARQAQDTADQV